MDIVVFRVRASFLNLFFVCFGNDTFILEYLANEIFSKTMGRYSIHRD